MFLQLTQKGASPYFIDSMLSNQVQDLVIPRASLEKPRRSIGSSYSYSKLPEEPIKLSVRKLDGSSFGTFIGFLSFQYVEIVTYVCNFVFGFCRC